MSWSKDRMMTGRVLNKMMVGAGTLLVLTLGHAGIPVLTLTPLTATTVTVAANDTAMVQYHLTNQSKRVHRLVMTPIPGITPVTIPGNCSMPAVLGYHQSCTLTLAVNGGGVTGDVLGGPVVCEQGNPNECYQPSQANRLAIRLTQAPPVNTATLTPSVSTLALSVNCPATSTSPDCAQTNAQLTGTPRQITITNTGDVV